MAVVTPLQLVHCTGNQLEPWNFRLNANSLQVKRKNMGCKIFSREAGNVTSRHSFKFSGLANTKVPFAAFGGWQV
jgi:hypothetical protein